MTELELFNNWLDNLLFKIRNGEFIAEYQYEFYLENLDKDRKKIKETNSLYLELFTGGEFYTCYGGLIKGLAIYKSDKRYFFVRKGWYDYHIHNAKENENNYRRNHKWGYVIELNKINYIDFENMIAIKKEDAEKLKIRYEYIKNNSENKNRDWQLAIEDIIFGVEFTQMREIIGIFESIYRFFLTGKLRQWKWINEWM